MFREPRCIEMAPEGDRRRWLWVMEPELGFIYGKAFEVTARELCTVADPERHVEELKRDAYETMIERSKDPDNSKPEGSAWEVFV